MRLAFRLGEHKNDFVGLAVSVYTVADGFYHGLRRY